MAAKQDDVDDDARIEESRRKRAELAASAAPGYGPDGYIPRDSQPYAFDCWGRYRPVETAEHRSCQRERSIPWRRLLAAPPLFPIPAMPTLKNG